MMTEMNEKSFMSQAPCTAAGEVPRELDVLGVHHQQVAVLPLALLDSHILDGLRLEAVLPALFALRSRTFSLSESASL